MIDPSSREYPEYSRNSGVDAIHPRSHTVATEKIMVEAKTFFLDLQENHRGRYFKVSEDAHGRRNTIIIPWESASLFLEALNRLLAESEARPGAAGQAGNS